MRGKFTVCSRCGQIGLPLVNVGTRREKEYVCREDEQCKRRQHATSLVGPICSYWFCTEKAEYKCNCGMFLCKEHKNMAAHYGHAKMKVKEK